MVYVARFTDQARGKPRYVRLRRGCINWTARIDEAQKWDLPSSVDHLAQLVGHSRVECIPLPPTGVFA